MNGWYMEAYDMFAAFAVGSYEGKVAYCIEPGTPTDNGHTFTAKDETFWQNYPSLFNKCGIHVHVDASPHNVKTLRSIVNIMAAKEDLRRSEILCLLASREH